MTYSLLVCEPSGQRRDNQLQRNHTENLANSNVARISGHYGRASCTLRPVRPQAAAGGVQRPP